MAQTNPSFAPDLHDADLCRAVLTGLALDSSAISMFRVMLKQYWQLSGLRQQVAEQDQAPLVNNPDSYRLMTVPGIGPTNALTVIPEAGDLRCKAYTAVAAKLAPAVFGLVKNGIDYQPVSNTASRWMSPLGTCPLEELRPRR